MRIAAIATLLVIQVALLLGVGINIYKVARIHIRFSRQSKECDKAREAMTKAANRAQLELYWDQCQAALERMSKELR